MSETVRTGNPPGWSEGSLGDVMTVIRGVTYRKEDSAKIAAEGFVPVLRANAIREHLSFEDLVYVPESYVSELQMLRPGDNVVAASSGSASLVGKAAQLRHGWRGSFGAFCFVLRPEAGLESRYLGWFLHTKEYRNHVSKASAGVNINNIRAEHLQGTPLRVPPAAEQTRIANTLDELLSDLDAGVAALERVRAKLKHYRAAVLKAAVEGSLTAQWRREHPPTETADALLTRILAERRRRWEDAQLAKFAAAGKAPPKNWKAKYVEPSGPDTTVLPSLPKEWCWATVEQLAAHEPNAITDGPFGSNLMTGHYTDEGPRVIRLQNIKDGTFADERAHISSAHFQRLQKHVIEAGDIAIAALSESPPRACIIPESVGPAIVKADCIRFKPHADLFARCLCFFLNSPPTRIRTKKIVHGVGRPRLNLGEIRAIALPLLPIREQEFLVSEVEDQLSVIDHLERDLDARPKSAQALRQSILRHAFTGQLVPQDPNDEPASELLKRIAAEREERARLAVLAKRKAKPARAGKARDSRRARTDARE